MVSKKIGKPKPPRLPQLHPVRGPRAVTRVTTFCFDLCYEREPFSAEASPRRGYSYGVRTGTQGTPGTPQRRETQPRRSGKADGPAPLLYVARRERPHRCCRRDTREVRQSARNSALRGSAGNFCGSGAHDLQCLVVLHEYDHVEIRLFPAGFELDARGGGERGAALAGNRADFFE